MWRKIRVLVATIVAIGFLAIVTAQATHAWRKTKEGLEQEGAEPDCSAQVAAATVANATSCKPDDLSCQIQQQSNTISRLQAVVNDLAKTAKEALTKANAAAEAAQKVGKAALSAHNAREAEASKAVAPLDGIGAPPLPSTPIPQKAPTSPTA